ncbi:INO80 chromatin remodeling complex Ies1 [Histoplasma capsulatum var. duboisii H88]|uniref:INO80 chromatin remodeling complex Ies1 n=1 Tax=Ajellomyces capsulatus (strain H88) TaxID=544711 RepID=A0A8A1LPP7_AJEC8|nr:INO80 chromatin remodeling complex Ies1 [Histoplasma capsulatum var. duboisii H88]
MGHISPPPNMITTAPLPPSAPPNPKAAQSGNRNQRRNRPKKGTWQRKSLALNQVHQVVFASLRVVRGNRGYLLDARGRVVLRLRQALLLLQKQQLMRLVQLQKQLT